MSLRTPPSSSYLYDLHNIEASAQLCYKHLVSMRSQLDAAPYAVSSLINRPRGLRVSSPLNLSVSLSLTPIVAASVSVLLSLRL